MNAKIEVKPTGRSKPLGLKTLPLFAVTADGVLVGEFGPKTAQVRAEVLERILEHADTLPFALWLLQVDVLCTKTLGVGLFDLPDMMTRDAFEDGVTPEDFFNDTVMETAREEGWS